MIAIILGMKDVIGVIDMTICPGGCGVISLGDIVRDNMLRQWSSLTYGTLGLHPLHMNAAIRAS